MARSLACITVLLLAPLAVGCATCDAPFDNQYTANGGIVERPDTAHGRINSAFVPTSRPLPPAEPGQDNLPAAANYMQPAPAAAAPIFDERDIIYFGAPANR